MNSQPESQIRPERFDRPERNRAERFDRPMGLGGPERFGAPPRAPERFGAPRAPRPPNPNRSLKYEELNNSQKKVVDSYVQPQVKKGQQPILNLQLYNPPGKKPPPQQGIQLPLVPIMTPGGPHPSILYQPSNIPIIKNYNINVSGPYEDPIKVAAIYEDILPERSNSEAHRTISERMILLSKIRSSVIAREDGEFISIGKGVGRSLLSYVKFLGLNPHHSFATNNPYKTLPPGLLIYKTCYPIKLSKYTDIVCSPNAVSINTRIYEISRDALEKRKSDEDYHNHKVWRELTYYEFIKEQVLRRGVCPNFVLMYAYLKHKDSKIKFGNRPPQSSENLVMLTEGPTMNIFDWATNIYEGVGMVRTMINSGYHHSDVWLSVIFQIIAGLYTMQLYGITISNFSLPKNVYIKTLGNVTSATNYWRYDINGVSYYIPNYGYLALIDSGYTVTDDNLFEGMPYPNYDPNTVRERTHRNFLASMSPNNFLGAFEREGGIKPNNSVMRVLDDITSNPSGRGDIGIYLVKHMRMFMNNRIGTYLRDTEIEKVITVGERLRAYHGDMIVQEVRNDTYRFVMFILPSGLVLTKDENDNIIEVEVPISNLYNYSEDVVQNHKIMSFGESNLLEVYKMGSVPNL